MVEEAGAATAGGAAVTVADEAEGAGEIAATAETAATEGTAGKQRPPRPAVWRFG